MHAAVPIGHSTYRSKHKGRSDGRMSQHGLAMHQRSDFVINRQATIKGLRAPHLAVVNSRAVVAFLDDSEHEMFEKSCSSNGQAVRGEMFDGARMERTNYGSCNNGVKSESAVKIQGSNGAN